MHGYPPSLIHCLNANPYPSTSQENVVAPLPATSRPLTSLASASNMEKVQQATAHELNDAKCSTKSSYIVDVECSTKSGDSVEEPKAGLIFTSKKELFEYYKSYSKQCGFPVVTLRSKKTDDRELRYVTIGCARAGKPRNRTANVRRLRPTSKTYCKTKVKRTYTLIPSIYNIVESKPKVVRYARMMKVFT